MMWPEGSPMGSPSLERDLFVHVFNHGSPEEYKKYFYDFGANERLLKIF